MKRQGRSSHTTALLEPGSERGLVKHPFPMNYILKPWKLGQWFYQVVKFGIVQYVCLLSFRTHTHIFNLLLPEDQPDFHYY